MPVPIAVVPSNKLTVLPASAVPVKVGLVTLVRLSVLDTPLSDAATRSGVVGAAGATSRMTDLAGEGTEIAGEVRDLGLNAPARGMTGGIGHAPCGATSDRGSNPGPPAVEADFQGLVSGQRSGKGARHGPTGRPVIGDEVARDDRYHPSLRRSRRSRSAPL